MMAVGRIPELTLPGAPDYTPLGIEPAVRVSAGV
jgi:hypothetical protein